MDTQQDDIAKEVKRTLSETGQITTDLVRKNAWSWNAHRKNQQGRRNIMIMIANWGQYVDGGKDKTKTGFQGPHAVASKRR